MAIYFACQISNCGQLLVVVALESGTAPAGGYDQLLGVTAVSGTPTLHQNGSACTIGPATWDQGQGDELPGSAVFFLLTVGSVLSTDVMTVDIPANFVNGSSPAYTAVAVTNNTGRIEKAFGANPGAGFTGCPGIDFTPTTKAGVNPGGPMVGNYTPNFLPWNQCLRAANWGFASGSSGALNTDRYGNPVSWTAGQTIRLQGFESSYLYDIGGGSGNGLDSKGFPNQVGKWTLVWDDTEAGTANASTVTLFCDGSISPGASVTLVSSTTVGTTTTAIYNAQYTSATPSAWDVCLTPHVSAPANNTGGTDGLSHWAISGLWLSPPNMADGTAMTVMRTNPFAVNPNVVTQLTGGGTSISHIRAMESVHSYGSRNNYIFESDAPNINGPWGQQITLTATANHVRAVNTNPSSGTYTWSSTKVYGPQADFVLSDGLSDTITATLTTGSNAITITAGSLTMAGGHVTGTGVTTGTRLARFVYGGTTTAYLSRPATVSGSETLTVAHPGYLALTTGDGGGFTENGNGQANWGVCELRWDNPHGLVTGDLPSGNSNSNNNEVTYSVWGPAVVALGYTRLYVTGPYTAIIAQSLNPSAGTTIQYITQTTEYNFTSTGGIVVEVDIPFDTAGTLPMEAHAAMCAQLGADCFRTISAWGTDELRQAEARKFYAYGGPTIHCQLEVEDEPWNDSSYFAINCAANIARANLWGYQTSGTVISEYLTTTGSALPFASFGLNANALLTGHFANVFSAAFVAAGGSSSRIERVIGCQFSYAPGTTDVSAGALQQWGIPCDWFIVGPYFDMPSSSSIATAFEVSGGDWPLGAINDSCRLYHIWNYANQNNYYGHMQPLLTWGEPTQLANFQSAGGGHGGNFAPFGGGYCAYYTFLDGSSNETTVGLSCSVPAAFNQNDAAQWIVPPVPAWCKSVNLYIAGPGASQNDGTERLYGNYPIATYPSGTMLTLTATPPGVTPPPTSNSVPSSTAGTPPKLAAYEGGEEKIIPTNTTNWQALTHDALAHPSRWLNTYTWFAGGQIGCQWLPGSGLSYAIYYEVWSNPGETNSSVGDDIWIIYAGIGQPPGQGLSNQYALKGAPADGHDHNAGAPLATGFNGVQVANQSPSGWGLQQWLTAMSPTPTPSAPPSRRLALRIG